MTLTPNRIAVILTVLAGIAGAVAPVVANMDWTSTAGVIAGLLAIVTASVKWLDGWQKWEATSNKPVYSLAKLAAKEAVQEVSAPVDPLGGTPPGEPGPITRRTP